MNNKKYFYKDRGPGFVLFMTKSTYSVASRNCMKGFSKLTNNPKQFLKSTINRGMNYLNK